MKQMDTKEILRERKKEKEFKLDLNDQDKE